MNPAHLRALAHDLAEWSDTMGGGQLIWAGKLQGKIHEKLRVERISIKERMS
jgi:hypothetical protein